MQEVAALQEQLSFQKEMIAQLEETNKHLMEVVGQQGEVAIHSLICQQIEKTVITKLESGGYLAEN